jgi:Spy/CpxP family protein refolding chaperone
MRARGLIGFIAISMTAAASGIGAQPMTGAPTQDRTALEQQLRQRAAQVVRKRLGLNDSQMTQLQGVNARYAPKMSDLAGQERETRLRLRLQMTSPSADQAEVARLLDSLLAFQKQRVALLESEQKDLAGFLSPVQRAQYMGLQAQIKRRADQLRRRQAGPLGQARNGILR